MQRVAVDRLADDGAATQAREQRRGAQAGVRDPVGVDASARSGATPRSAGPAASPCGARCAGRTSPPRAAPWSCRRRPRCAAPPMTPASATAPRPSAMTMSPSCSGRSTPSSVVMRSARFARRTTMPPLISVEIERVQRVTGLQHHVVGDVDQVRDRAHAARRQPDAHLDRARRRAHAGDDARRVARAGGRVADLDVDPATGRQRRRHDLVGARQLPPRLEQRRDLARDAGVRQRVGAVGRDVDLQHLVDQAERARHVGARAASTAAGSGSPRWLR